MKLNEHEMSIKEISDVTKGTINVKNVHCEKRNSDGFIYVLSGSAGYTFSGKSFTVKSGDVFYLAKGSTYDIRIIEFEYSFIFVNFSFESSVERESEVYAGAAITALESTFFKMMKSWNFGDFSDKIECKAYLYTIYAAIARETVFGYAPAKIKKQLEKTIDYFSRNFGNPELTVADLAKVCGVSEGHFRRIFLKAYHMPPVKYMNLYRLNTARQMLASTDLTISETAARCGFNSVYYFDRMFMREWGIQPGRYKSGYADN